MLLLIADVYISVKFIPDKKQKKAPTYSIAEEWKKAILLLWVEKPPVEIVKKYLKNSMKARLYKAYRWFLR